MSNERAKVLLGGAGLTYEYEPDWITEGRKPDFYCSGPTKVWCEVKTFEGRDNFAKLDYAVLELRRRVKNVSARGRGIAYVSDSLTTRDAKVIVQLLKRAISRFEYTDAPNRVVALIPRNPNYSDYVKFSVATKDRAAVEIHSCVAATGNYGIPMDTRPVPTSQLVRFRFASGGEKETSQTGA